jgi:putative N6-adenine-specific DNA methylase
VAATGETARALFAVTAPGLEPFTAEELTRLGLAATPEPGGAAFSGGDRTLMLANLHLRTASRVLLRLGEFYAAAFSELRKKASRLPWERHLSATQPITLRATSHKSRLYHSGAVAERVAGAVADRLGREVVLVTGSDEAEAAHAQLITVRLVHDLCTISVDTSGALLHQRGYRLAGAKAPLRETLAAAMLLAAAWEPGAPLLDPFCGSGTVPIEAALLARGIAPGKRRRFAFMDWPGFDARLWRRVLAQAEAGESAAAPAPILGSDRDAGAIAAARANAERAGVDASVALAHKAVSAIAPPPGPGWVVTNPPYGVRTQEARDLRNLYAQFGHALRARCAGWHVAVLAGSDALLRSTGLAFDRRASLALVNGGLPVTLARGRVGPN